MDKFFVFAGLGAGVVALVLLISFLFSVPVWLLWNYCLVGAVTGGNEVSWLQAWGVLILCNLLFKTTVSKKD